MFNDIVYDTGIKLNQKSQNAKYNILRNEFLNIQLLFIALVNWYSRAKVISTTFSLAKHIWMIDIKFKFCLYPSRYLTDLSVADMFMTEPSQNTEKDL